MKHSWKIEPDPDSIQQIPLCAVVVAYFPSASQTQALSGWLPVFDMLIVVDNTPASATSAVLALNDLASHERVRVIRNRHNLGIAAALNIGVQTAQGLGFRWVATFDQDSRPSSAVADFFHRFLQSGLSKEKVGVLGVNYINANNGRPGVMLGPAPAELAEVRTVITSGSLLNLQCYEMIGGFCEKYFIDMVDTEYCYRARKNGYVILVSSQPLMEHSVGTLQKIRLLGREVAFSQHSPLRQYYIFRNTLYMVKQYWTFDFGGCLQLLAIYLPKVWIKGVCLGAHKISSLKMMSKGIYEGLFQ